MDNKQKDGIYNAKELGAPKTVILGLQHMFAMFGSTVLVPILTGLSVSTTLLFAGLGTLIFHFITKRKVPATATPAHAYGSAGLGTVKFPLASSSKGAIAMYPPKKANDEPRNAGTFLLVMK